MKQEPLYVAFSTQKGGVGKTTFTVLAASCLHYLRGYNILVVDCDFPQFSIQAMRKRDSDQVMADEYYKQMLVRQFEAIEKKAYPILNHPLTEVIPEVEKYLRDSGESFDIVFFDLPGTVQSTGVIQTIAAMDYIFVPIVADRVVMESSLSFASVIQSNLIGKAGKMKRISLFWNLVDGREKSELYTAYEKVIAELELPLMQAFIPDTKRYRKEISSEHKPMFRSTLFPPDKYLMKGSGIENLINEMCELLKL